MLALPKGHRCQSEDILIVSFLQPGVEGRGYGSADISGRRFLAGLALWPLILHDLHDAVAVWHSLIDRKFIDCPDADNQRDRHAGGESENIDKGVATVFS